MPPNVRFEIDDVEADWTYTSKFDYIHCRCMGNAIRDWPRLFRQVHEYVHDTPPNPSQLTADDVH